jgi:hypothetical protein
MKNVSRICLFLLVFLLLPTAAFSADYYYAQIAAGATDGSSCANAYAYNDGTNGWNQAAKQGPDITSHVCGTITIASNTNAWNVTTAGTSGHPYTLKFETGAIIQAPYFPYAVETSGTVAGLLTINTKNYVVIDGGTNGLIKTTANGTLLANKQNSTGISIKACTGCIVKNLEIGPVYVHSGTTDTSGFGTDGIVMYQNPSVTVDNVNVHQASFPLYPYMSTSGTWNQEMKNSRISDYNEGVRCPNSAPSGVGLSIHDNHFTSVPNWNVNSTFHNNGIHCYSLGSGINMSHPLVYNNIFDGTMGTNNTAAIYMEGTSSGNIADMWVANNVIISGSSSDVWYVGLIEANGTNMVIVNNTVIGSSKNGGFLNACIGIGSGSTNVIIRNNTCQTFNNAIARFQTTTTWSAVSNNNYYNYNTFGVTYNVGNFSFATWQGIVSGDASPPTTPNTNPNVQTSSPFLPNTGSVLIGAGANLTAMCSQTINGITAPWLCLDINGVARPTGSTPWDVGAAQSTGASTRPNPPTSLTGSVI